MSKYLKLKLSVFLSAFRVVERVKCELVGVAGTAAASAAGKTSTNRSSKHYPVSPI